MKGMGVMGILRLILVAATLWVAPAAFAEEMPDWELVVAENTQATFEAVKLHPKENAWLLTCRMRVKSLNLVPAISEIELVGLAAPEEIPEEEAQEELEPEEVVLWEKSHTIRSKDYEAAYGGGRSQFVRIFIRDVPADVARIELRYAPDEESE